MSASSGKRSKSRPFSRFCGPSRVRCWSTCSPRPRSRVRATKPRRTTMRGSRRSRRRGNDGLEGPDAAGAGGARPVPAPPGGAGGAHRRGVGGRRDGGGRHERPPGAPLRAHREGSGLPRRRGDAAGPGPRGGERRPRALPYACGRRDGEDHGRDASAGDPVTSVYPKPLRRLVLLLSRLPGIGEKTATRLSMFLLKMPPEFVRELGAAISGIPESVTKCSKCFNIADEDPCGFCADPARRDDLICVVEGPTDIVPIEKSGEFKGRYHVLGGAISPIDGVMPDDLRVRELLERTARSGVSEVILATNLTAEGEATASYLAEVLKARNIRVSRIAYGLPMGADLEYADEITVGRAMKGRREL